MKYPLELINLEIKLALKVSLILQKPLTQVLIDYTDFYKQFRYGTDYNPNNPKWVSYINNFSTDPEYTYYHSIKERAASDKSSGKNPQEFGCFSYDYTETTKTIHIHFANNTHEPQGPLSIAVIDSRREELRNMFNYINCKHPNARFVRGHSWLYNLDSYTRLFPKNYVESKKFNGWKLQYRSYWGQFLNSEGEVKKDLQASFKDNLQQACCCSDCVACAKYKPLAVKGEIGDFYSFY